MKENWNYLDVSEKFLEQIYTKEDIKEGVAFIADKLREFYVAKKYATIINILRSADVSKLEIPFLLGLITFSNPILPLERIIPKYCEDLPKINKERQNLLNTCKVFYEDQPEKKNCFEREKIPSYKQTLKYYKYIEM